MRYNLSPEATAQVANTHPRQVWFFVMSSRKESAIVLAAYICKDTAQREARKIKSVTRMGVLIAGQADTL